MPIYEFECNECGNIFSDLRAMSDNSAAKCLKCGSLNTKKIMSSFATGSSVSSSDCLPSGGG